MITGGEHLRLRHDGGFEHGGTGAQRFKYSSVPPCLRVHIKLFAEGDLCIKCDVTHGAGIAEGNDKNSAAAACGIDKTKGGNNNNIYGAKR